jgi:hypothetical protein
LKHKAADEYFALFDDLYARHNGADTRILLAPLWAHGVTDAFLRRVRVRSDALGGVPIHMHLLQTPVQKAYGLRRRGVPTLEWLDGLGMVDRRVAYGHAIHVTERDIELMGRRGACVTTHPSCNLHMRNGITPVVPMRAAGVTVAMGMDDKTINDDEDAVMEVRMLHKLHRLHSFDLTAPALDAYEAFEMATVNGAKACGFEGETGALLPGMKADAIVVDLARVERDPWIDPRLDVAEGLVQRALGEDVRTVIIGGRIVMEDRRIQTIDSQGRSLLIGQSSVCSRSTTVLYYACLRRLAALAASSAVSRPMYRMNFEPITAAESPWRLIPAAASFFASSAATPGLFSPSTRTDWRLLVTLKPNVAAAATSASPRSGVTNTTPMPGFSGARLATTKSRSAPASRRPASIFAKPPGSSLIPAAHTSTRSTIMFIIWSSFCSLSFILNFTFYPSILASPLFSPHSSSSIDVRLILTFPEPSWLFPRQFQDSPVS